MKHLLVVPLILALGLSGCNVASPDLPAPAVPVTADKVCSKIRAAVIGRGDYPASQVAGCFEVTEQDPPGFYVTRLNAVCQQEVCGSVLLGWYAVEADTGRVFEWDIVTLEIGPEIISTP